MLLLCSLSDAGWKRNENEKCIIYVNCISVTGIELLLSAGMSIHFRSGNSSTRHDQFLAKVMPNFSVNSNSFSSSISASHHVVSRRVRGALQ
jgi:hypothetical protein